MNKLPSIVLTSVLVALTVSPVAAMSGYRWKHRPVVVIAGPNGGASLVEQRHIFSTNISGLRERDVVIIWVAGNTVSADLGPGPGLSAEQLRQRFGAPDNGFRVILVGKDGGTKLSRPTPLPANVLFGTIDAMPMRRDEMRRGR
jgi:hypothetical protein